MLIEAPTQARQETLELDGRLAVDDRGADWETGRMTVLRFVPLTRDYIAAIEGLLRAHLAMMRSVEPLGVDNLPAWTWGVARIDDLRAVDGLTMEFGGDSRRPDYLPADTEVIVLVERHCRVCGCTNEYGCPMGCTWVEEDLCSACKDAMTPKAPEGAGNVVS